jgi:hypothetical protein
MAAAVEEELEFSVYGVPGAGACATAVYLALSGDAAALIAAAWPHVRAVRGASQRCVMPAASRAAC